MYLYDTNILSEMRKKSPNEHFSNFIAAIKESQDYVFISSITLGEIIKGIETLKRRKDFVQAKHLQNWYDHDIQPFARYALPFDTQCAEVWGKLMAINPHNPIDKQLAAVTLVHDLVLVTRNSKDIEKIGVRFINPFINN